MKKIFLCIAIPFAIYSTYAQTPADCPEIWEIYLYDKFDNQAKFDTTWDILEGVTRSHTDMYTTADEVDLDLDSGKLILTASEILDTNLYHNDSLMHFYAAEVVTKEKIKYGFFEAKIKFPDGTGYFPALWFWNINHAWPPEIDVMEHVGKINDTLNKITGANRWSPPNGGDTAVNCYSLLNGDANHPGNSFHSQYHRFACEWSKDLVIYYVNGVEVGRYTDHISNVNMNYLISLQIAYWRSPYDDETINNMDTITFKVDWVKIWKRKSSATEYGLENNWTASNDSKISSWYLNDDDTYIIGDFENGNAAEFLAISALSSSASEYTHMIEYEDNEWIYPKVWGNDGSLGFLSTWSFDTKDQFVSGNFDGLDGDELLLISDQSGYAHLKKFDDVNDEWLPTLWSNAYSGNLGKIGSWYISEDDQYFTSDFTGNGSDELLSISPNNQYVHIKQYDHINNEWISPTLWGSNNYTIGNWSLNIGDKFITGDFTNNGKDELITISANSKNAYLQRFNASISNNWDNNTFWDNNGNYKLASWTIKNDDHYISGDFTNSGYDQLLCISSSGQFLRLLSFNTSTMTFDILWSKSVANSDLTSRMDLSNAEIYNIAINGEKDQVFIINKVNSSCENYSTFMMSVPDIVSNVYQWQEVDQRTDIASDIVYNSTENRIFYRDKTNDIDGLYYSSGWNWWWVQNANDVAGDLAFNSNEDFLFYRTTDGDIDAFEKSGINWLKNEVISRTDVAGDIVADNINQIFYRDNTNDIDGLYYGSIWHWMSVIGRNDIMGPIAIDPDNNIYYKDNYNDIDGLRKIISYWLWMEVQSVNDVANEIVFNQDGDMFYIDNTGDIDGMIDNSGWQLTNIIDLEDVASDLTFDNSGNLYYVDNTGDIDGLRKEGGTWKWKEVIALDNVAGDLTLVTCTYPNTLMYKTVTGDIDAITVPSKKSNFKSGNDFEKDENISNLLQIYPNPNDGYFTISSAKEQINTIEVMDYLGRVVYSIQSNSIKQEINLHWLPRGIYIVRIITENENTLKRILIE